MIQPQEYGYIFDIQHFSTHDGPGIRTAVFFKGCPLHCRWCYNPESQRFQPELMVRESLCSACGACVETCPEGALAMVEGKIRVTRDLCKYCGACIKACPEGALQMVGRRASVKEVMEEISRDAAFYEQSGGGVTFSGGEALTQSGFLLALLLECHKLNIHTTLDTSGYVPWSTFSALMPFIDLYLYDLKIMDHHKHLDLVGEANYLILENLERLSYFKKKIILRVPIIPGCNDDEENLKAVGKFAASLDSVILVELMPYSQQGVKKYKRLGRDYALKDLQPPTPERMKEIQMLMLHVMKDKPVNVLM